jgi:outer membrane protein TolC
MKRYIIILVLISGLYFPLKSQTLSLDSCKIYALKNNKRLREAQLKLDASKEVKKNAFTNYFPKVDAGATAMKSSKSFIEMEFPEMNLPVYDGIPANIATATQFAYFPGMNIELLDYANVGYVSAIQPIYAGGRIRNGNKLASLGEELSGYNLNLTTDEVLVKTEEYYWTIVNLEEKKETLKSYKNLLNNLLKDVSVAYEAGLIQKSD